LDATLSHFPTDVEASQFSFEVSHAIETLFLTDHCFEIDGPHSDEEKNFLPKVVPQTPEKTTIAGDQHMATPSTPVVPITQKRRNSVSARLSDLNELIEVGKDANLLLDDERPQSELVPSYSTPVPTYNSSGSKIGDLFESNPIVFAVMTVGLMIFLKRSATIAVTLDLDVLMLFIWAAFCIGLNSPRPMITGMDKNFGPQPSSPSKSKATDLHGRKLLRKMSMQMSPRPTRKMSREVGASLDDDVDDDSESESEIMDETQSPLPVFPKGAELGSHFNCWSQPSCETFYVRGPKYLKNRVKIESGDFLWPVRGVDLFLTDTPPENAGRYVYSAGQKCFSWKNSKLKPLTLLFD
jgi:hypothetical protein